MSKFVLFFYLNRVEAEAIDEDPSTSKELHLSLKDRANTDQARQELWALL